MKKWIDRQYIKMQCFLSQLKKEEQGLEMIEIAIILVVIVGLAVIFRSTLEGIFDTLKTKIEGAIKNM